MRTRRKFRTFPFWFSFCVSSKLVSSISWRHTRHTRIARLLRPHTTRTKTTESKVCLCVRHVFFSNVTQEAKVTAKQKGVNRVNRRVTLLPRPTSLFQRRKQDEIDVTTMRMFISVSLYFADFDTILYSFSTADYKADYKVCLLKNEHNLTSKGAMFSDVSYMDTFFFQMTHDPPKKRRSISDIFTSL